MGFEPMTPVTEWGKTVHALDRAATMIGIQHLYLHYIQLSAKFIFEAVNL
jgi:hypothetical protein